MTADVAANFTGPDEMLSAGRDLRVAVRVSIVLAAK